MGIGLLVMGACTSSSSPAANDGGAVDDSATQPPPPADGGADSAVPADASGGCVGADETYRSGTTAGTIMVGGRAREFRVHVPPGYSRTKATPVVLLFHGGGGSARQIEEESAKMNPIADREGFIAVYPNGIGVLGTWNGGLCCGRAVEEKVDDVAFVSALLDHLEAKLCTDRRRVFATGMSNGALMSHRLACELSSRIAAVAPVAGTIGVPECKPSRPVPVLQIHGSNDAHVPVQGGTGCGPSGASFVSVPATMEGWRDRNGCAPATAPTFEQGDGKCVGYTGCKAPVVLCTIDGGGHSWPGGEPKTGVADCPADGAQSTTFVASEVAWTFFKENPMPE